MLSSLGIGEKVIEPSHLILSCLEHEILIGMLNNMEQQSQLDPLPKDLPFRIISKTIGRGAYAS